ncbi:hypothetical protein BDR06DRAFT_1009519 [Suillus hirtellus]|nr:hypothetical protein BDR06DRAFT_1009519 [Suillus hirtellus]
MGDKLDKEKGRESIKAPDFKRNTSTDLIRQRAVKHERSWEASQNARPSMLLPHNLLLILHLLWQRLHPHQT